MLEPGPQKQTGRTCQGDSCQGQTGMEKASPALQLVGWAWQGFASSCLNASSVKWDWPSGCFRAVWAFGEVSGGSLHTHSTWATLQSDSAGLQLRPSPSKTASAVACNVLERERTLACVPCPFIWCPARAVEKGQGGGWTHRANTQMCKDPENPGRICVNSSNSAVCRV